MTPRGKRSRSFRSATLIARSHLLFGLAVLSHAGPIGQDRPIAVSGGICFGGRGVAVVQRGIAGRADRFRGAHAAVRRQRAAMSTRSSAVELLRRRRAIGLSFSCPGGRRERLRETRGTEEAHGSGRDHQSFHRRLQLVDFACHATTTHNAGWRSGCAAEIFSTRPANLSRVMCLSSMRRVAWLRREFCARVRSRMSWSRSRHCNPSSPPQRRDGLFHHIEGRGRECREKAPPRSRGQVSGNGPRAHRRARDGAIVHSSVKNA